MTHIVGVQLVGVEGSQLYELEADNAQQARVLALNAMEQSGVQVERCLAAV